MASPRARPPSRSIVVCTLPGADSEVAGLLQRCGAGEPLEYFDLNDVAPALVRRWRVINLDDSVTALHHHCSADSGVFGVVVAWRHLRGLHHDRRAIADGLALDPGLSRSAR